MRLFTLDLDQQLAVHTAERLGTELSPVEIRSFSDGDFKIRPLVDVNGHDVYLIHALFNEAGRNVHEKLSQLLFMIGALKDALARSVTVLAPYLCYARKDQRTKARDPLSLKYLAALFEAVGTDQIITIDVHNVAAFESTFRIPTEHLSATELLAHCLMESVSQKELTIVSPDLGGVKRAERFLKLLDKQRSHGQAKLAFIEKQRSEGQIVSGRLIGDVKGCTAIIYDDLIASGETIVRAANACKKAGAVRVLAVATHVRVTGNCASHLMAEAIDGIYTTNTICNWATLPDQLKAKMTVADCAKVCAKAIEACRSHATLAELSDQA